MLIRNSFTKKNFVKRMKVGGLEKKRVNLMNMEWNEIFNYSSFALKNMCSTFFFFNRYFITVTIFLMTIMIMIIKCNITGGEIFREILLHDISSQHYLHFSFLDIRHFSSLYPKFFFPREPPSFTIFSLI